MTSLNQKTILITGATQGIGLAIALKLASCGANLVILSKDSEEGLKKAHEQFSLLGKSSLILKTDVSNFNELEKGVQKAVQNFGSIDALINNTSATCFKSSENLTSDEFDLMIQTSAKAAFFLAQLSLPYLRKSENPHILNISPPLNLDPRCFKDYLGFSLSKYAMSLCTLGLAEEFKNEGIAINSLWPKSVIGTQTITKHFSSQVYASSRKPSIMADAAYEILKQRAQEVTGLFFIDEDILKKTGITDFSSYTIDSSRPLMQALFIPKDDQMLEVSNDLFNSN